MLVSRAYKLVRAGVLGVAVLILLLGATAARLTYQYLDANGWVRHTTQVIAEVRATRSLLGIAAASGPTRSATETKIAAIREQLDRVANLTRDNKWQQKNIADFRAQIDTASTGTLGSTAVFAAGTLDAANAILDRMQREEYGLLLQRSTTAARAMQNAGIAILGLCFGLAVLGIATAITARNEFFRRAKAEATLQHEKQELTRYTGELALVSAGSELVQAIQDEEQLGRAVSKVLQDLLPGSFGYFALVTPSHDSLQLHQHWGEGKAPESFLLSSCVALQLGRQVHRSENDLHAGCTHIQPGAGDYICLPIRSSNSHLGLLHVATSNRIPANSVSSLALFSAHIGLALTNLRIRESLRNQSVRDSLTGLFNRRYFDETLQREIAAAQRDETFVSVLLLDLDHFKRTNDTFGHAAGDDALRAFARLLQSAFRESDVLCRYGGEEFAVILACADLEHAYSRAESFRELLERSEFQSHDQALGPIRTSIGVACSSEFLAPSELLHAADAALYEAKRTGRNRTCVCSSQPAALPVSSRGSTNLLGSADLG